MESAQSRHLPCAQGEVRHGGRYGTTLKCGHGGRPALWVAVVAGAVALGVTGSKAHACCQNQLAIDTWNTGCDLAWTTCNVGCAAKCCFGFCTNSSNCKSCASSCNDKRNTCRSNAPSCVECQDIGEKCEIISTWPAGPGKCKDNLSCYFISLTESRCGPPENGGQLFNQNLCAGLYSQATCLVNKGSDTTLTFGTSATAAAGATSTKETGIIYGRDGNYGCYATSCTGFTLDLTAGVALVSGFFDQDFDEVAGPDLEICTEIETPIANVGAGMCTVFQSTVDNGCDILNPQQVDGSCEQVGYTDDFGFGIGLLGTTIQILTCNTNTIKVGTMNDDCTLNVFTGNQPPSCDAGGPYLIECNGQSTTSTNAISASGSSDAENDPLTYSWTTDCPGGSFSSMTAESPTFSLNSNCGQNCAVYLTVSDGQSSTSCQGSVGIVDTMAPTITKSASNKIVECDGSGNVTDRTNWLNSNGGATASDTCSTATFSNNYTGLSNGCGATGSATVAFTATDGCGNSDTDCSDGCSVTSATFTIQDTTRPSITCPASQTLECPADTSVSATGTATSSDACGGTSVGSSDVTTPGCGNTKSIDRTWTATDACNLTSTCTQTIDVVDRTPPSIDTAASNKTVECDGAGNTADLAAWLSSYGGASGSDACGSVSWSDNFSALTDDCGATGHASVTFTATDECSLTSDTTAMFTIEDTTPPDLMVDTTRIVVTDVDCSGNEDVALPVASASDICGGVSISDNSPPTFQAGQTTPVTYTVQDDCGLTTDALLNVAVLYGASIDIEADRHTVGSGSAPGSTKEPLVGLNVCGYDKSDTSCARTVCGGISHQYYQCIVDNCAPTNCCMTPDGEPTTTDDNGECTIYLPPGDWIVISADATKTVLPDPLGVSASDLACGQVMQKHLQQIVKADGQIVPAKTTRFTGTELLIIEPEYVVWDDTEQLYPFVFETDGDWDVTTSVTPPEGFVSDYDALSASVDSDIQAVQFTIDEVGSDLVPTKTQFDIQHKGRSIQYLDKVDIFLTSKYARTRGFDVHTLQSQGLIKELPANSSGDTNRGGTGSSRSSGK